MRKGAVSSVACLLALAIAGTASATSSKSDGGAPVRKIRAGDEALARRIVLKDEDFPLGWKREAFGDQPNEGCAGIDYSDLMITGDAGSSFGDLRTGVFAFSVAEVYATRTQARNSLVRGSTREIGNCFRRSGVGEGGEDFEVVNIRVSTLPFQQLGDRSRSFLMAFEYDFGTQEVPARLEIVGVQRGRVVAGIGFLSVDERFPRDIELDLAKLLVARMS